MRMTPKFGSGGRSVRSNTARVSSSRKEDGRIRLASSITRTTGSGLTPDTPQLSALTSEGQLITVVVVVVEEIVVSAPVISSLDKDLTMVVVVELVEVIVVVVSSREVEAKTMASNKVKSAKIQPAREALDLVMRLRLNFNPCQVWNYGRLAQLFAHSPVQTAQPRS